jgi:Rrf2 family transcriptional regulator, nitric oxide-sensitive transcriptional repressor
MRLTIYTDFSLRLLTYLATHRDRVCTVKEIAEAYDISRHHLLKVANQLGNNGIVEATRGNGGGLRLAKPPHKINIGAIVRLTEPDFNLVSCFDASGGGCRIESVCILQRALHEATTAFLKVLDRYSLTDLMVHKASLVDILQPAGRPVKWLKVA